MKNITKPANIIEALRFESQQNPVFRDLCYTLSLRKRTRKNMTLVRMRQMMEHEGLRYSNEQYREIIRFLANLGIGKLMRSNRGLVKGLGDLKVKLPSLSRVALGQSSDLDIKRKPTYRVRKPITRSSRQPRTVKEPFFVEIPIIIRVDRRFLSALANVHVAPGVDYDA